MTKGKIGPIISRVVINGKDRIAEFCRRQGPHAKKAFDKWVRKVEAVATWGKFLDLRASFANHADVYKGYSGTEYVIFDVGGNKYRLMTRVVYGASTVMVVKAMTHQEYDTDRWKDGL